MKNACYRLYVNADNQFTKMRTAAISKVDNDTWAMLTDEIWVRAAFMYGVRQTINSHL